MNQLPISRIVRTTVNLTPGGAQAQSLSDLLILGTSPIIDTVERMRTYETLADVADDFGTTSEEYLGARRWFGQSPQPTRVRIGRWAKTPTKGGLRCAPLSVAQQAISNWAAITAGSFAVSIDGAAVIQVTALNFTGVTNLNAVAAIIDTALAGASCTWNAVYQRFEFMSDTAGASSSVSFLTAPAAGTNIADDLKGLTSDSGGYTYSGIIAEPVDAAMAIFDDRFGQVWYAAMAPAADAAANVLGAEYAQSSTNRHVWAVTTQDAATLLSQDTSCLAYLLKQGGYRKVFSQFSSLDAYAAFSAMGKALTVNYNGTGTVITLKFKQEPGVAPEALSSTQAGAVEAKNCNIFVQYDNETSILEQGVMADGTYADVVFGTDWLAVTIQTAMYNVLYTSPTKIPQTDGGVHLLQTAVEGVLSKAVDNGLLAPGVWGSQGFGTLAEGDFMAKGYYVYVSPIDQQLQADRAARHAPPFRIAVKMAGAVHDTDVEIVVNQ